jgi:NAD(P)-dependent dehydrogenase (short-subunit alcohol dehydrogenase family)
MTTPLQTPRSILITGCSSGIGLASAHVMQARGWRVFATARKPDDLTRLGAQGFTAVHLELRDSASIDACATSVLSACGGRLDAVFANAAYGQAGALEDISAEVLRDQFEVNVVGTHDLTRRLIPAMRRAGRGRIVLCSSVLGFAPSPFRGAYCASKFALEAIGDVLRMELRGSGIDVSLIEPGPIRSRFIENVLSYIDRNIDVRSSVHRATYETRIAALRSGGKTTFKLEPEAVAHKLVHAVESTRPRRRYYVTIPTYVAAIARRFAPPAVFEALLRKS